MNSQVAKGMLVFSSDGEELGKVVQVSARTFVSQRGLFFTTAYTLRQSDISEVDAGRVVVRQSLAALDETALIVVGGGANIDLPAAGHGKHAEDADKAA